MNTRSKLYPRFATVLITLLMIPRIASSQITISVAITGGQYDAEEYASEIGGEAIGTVDLYSSDLEIVFDHEVQYVGMIFQNVEIPAGASITDAYVQFTVDAVRPGITDAVMPPLEIYGAREANVAGPFTEDPYAVSGHPPTTAKVTGWSPPPSVAEGDAGPNERTPDISAVIQEIIGLDGWSSGNNIMIVITATDKNQTQEIKREMKSFDGDAALAPILNVTYVLDDFARNEKACQGEAIPPLTAIGDSIIWYSEPDYSGFLYTGNIFQTGKSEPGCYTYYVTWTFENGTVRKDTASLIISGDSIPSTPTAWGDTIYCPGDVMADIAAQPLSGGLISWYDGPDLRNLLGTGALYNPSGIASTTRYYITETVGDCESHPDEVRVEIRKTTPYEYGKICMVTVDANTGKNMIIWERTPDQGIAAHRIYRETNVSDTYDPIGLISFEDPGIFIDTGSDPVKQSWKYRIAALDSCNNESSQSAPHATMHLIILNSGFNAGTYLLWSKYEGFAVETYNIWRGSGTDNMFLIGSVSGSNFTFTDQYPLAGTNIYQVEVVSPYTCNPGNQKSSFSSSFSNLAYRYGVGIEEYAGSPVRIYPNPFNTRTTIEFTNPGREKYHMIWTDLTGKVVKIVDNITDDRFEVSRDGLTGGMYLIELKGPGTYRGKIIIE